MAATHAFADQRMGRIAINANDPISVEARAAAGLRLTPGGNRPPVANPDTYWLESITPLNYTNPTWLRYILRPQDNDFDPDGDGFSIFGLGSPNFGTSSFVSSLVRYVPNIGYMGSDAMSYSIIDTSANVASSTINMTLLPSQDNAAQVQRGYLTRAQLPHVFTDVKVDSEGATYVTGYTVERGDLGWQTGLTFKFRPDGTQAYGYLWYKENHDGFQFDRIVVGKSRVFYVGETYTGPENSWDVSVTTVLNDGTTYVENVVPLTSNDFVWNAKADSADNLIVSGYIGDSSAGLVKLDSNLNILWAKAFDGGRMGIYAGRINGLAIAPDDSIYAAGNVQNSDFDSLIARVSPTGATLWESVLDGSIEDVFNDVAIDIDGQPVAVGYSGAKALVRKMDADTGASIWTHSNTFPGFRSANGFRAIPTPSGIVVGGTVYRDSGGHSAVYLQKLLPDGTQDWFRTYVPANPSGFPNPVLAAASWDSFGGMYLAVNSYNEVSSSDTAHILAVDRFGNVRWDRYRQDPRRGSSTIVSVSANDQGVVASAGTEHFKLFETRLYNTEPGDQGTIGVYQQTPQLYNDQFVVGQTDTLTTRKGEILLNDSFVADGSVVLVKKPDAGILKLGADGTFTYVAPRASAGNQSFQYAVQRPGLPLSVPAIVFLKVASKPIAVRDTASAALETPTTIDVLANDSDPSGLPLIIVDVTKPSSGSVVIGNGNVVYTSNPGATGTDSFSYTISNGVFTATTVVTVKIVPDPFIATLNPPQVIAPGSGVTITVKGRNFGDIPGSIVRWNGSDRTTSYVSDTQLNVLLADSDVALETTGILTVKSALGRVSNAITIQVVGRPSLAITAQRTTGTTVRFTVTNSGTGSATNVALISAVINGQSSLTTPSIATKIAPGGVASVDVVFPAAAFPRPKNQTCKI
jgi:Bacterial Ig domain/IPT/TIG domain